MHLTAANVHSISTHSVSVSHQHIHTTILHDCDGARQMVQICMKNAIQVIGMFHSHHPNRFTENGEISY